MENVENNKTGLLHDTNGQTELDIFKDEAEQEKKSQLEEHTKSDVEEGHEDHELPQGKKELDDMEYAVVPIDQIEITPGHARRSLGDIDELKKSISAIGVKHPVLAAQLPDGRKVAYDGSRRLSVCKEININDIPCIITEMTVEEADRLSYIVNEQRATLTFQDKLHHIKKEHAKGYSFRDLEVLLGYGSAPHLSNIVKLDTLPNGIKEDIDSGALTMAHGHVLLKLPNFRSQTVMGKRIVKEGLSATKAAGQVEILLNKDDEENFDLLDNEPTEYAGIIKRRNPKMAEQTERSMSLVLSLLTKDSMKVGKRGAIDYQELSINTVMADVETKHRTGGIIGCLFHDEFNDNGHYGHSFVGRHLHPIFLKNDYWLKGRIIINIIADQKSERTFQKNSDAGHTEYNINDSVYDLYVYEQRDEKIEPSKVIEDQSRLAREDLIESTQSVWSYNLSDYGEHDEILLAIAKRFINLYSYIGDSVLDPFGANLAVVQAALELNRVPTCYINEKNYNPEEIDKIFNVKKEPVFEADWKTVVNKQDSKTLERLPETSDTAPQNSSGGNKTERQTSEDNSLNALPPVQDTPSADLSAQV